MSGNYPCGRIPFALPVVFAYPFRGQRSLRGCRNTVEIHTVDICVYIISSIIMIIIIIIIIIVIIIIIIIIMINVLF